jgi:hypothetical protein
MKLASGLDFSGRFEPSNLLSWFELPGGSPYDSTRVPQDNDLRPAEIVLSRKIVSRISNAEVTAIVRSRPQIVRELESIPNDVGLDQVPLSRRVPGIDAITGLVDLLDDIEGIGVATATKVLHVKRRGLIPVFDSRVGFYYAARLNNPISWDWIEAEDLPEMIDNFREDLHSVRSELQGIQRGLVQSGGIPVTMCRLLDHLIWRRLDPKIRRPEGVVAPAE